MTTDISLLTHQEMDRAAVQSRARRVMFIINSLAGGGAERVMCTLLRASEAEQRDCRVSLVLLDRDVATYRAPDWVEVHQFDSRHSLIRSVWSVIQAIRRVRPDITISFLTRANVANVIAASLLRVPAIVSERVNTASHLGRGFAAKIVRGLVRLTYPRAARVIAVSHGVAEDLWASFGVAAARTAVIANPIDTDRIQAQAGEGEPIALAAPFIVAMGRLMPNKNFPMLIDAFARSGLSGTLLILGEGPERAALTERIAALGLTGRVLMPGFLDNPFPTLARASIYVSSSNAEGFPNALLEAMSTGVPVIATNCPSGPSEVLADLPRDEIGDGVTYAPYGLLVPCNDADAMAEALRALADPVNWREYGARAAQRAADFGVERAKDAYWQVIRGVL